MDWKGVGGYGVTTSSIPGGNVASTVDILITNSCKAGCGIYILTFKYYISCLLFFR
jgi:hypothetical protein